MHEWSYTASDLHNYIIIRITDVIELEIEAAIESGAFQIGIQ